MAVRILRIYPHTIQVWGIVSFVLVGFCQSLHIDIRKSTPHFLFVYYSLGVGEWEKSNNKRRRKKMKKMFYSAPAVEYYSMQVEQGFATSGGQLPEYKEDDDVIIIG